MTRHRSFLAAACFLAVSPVEAFATDVALPEPVRSLLSCSSAIEALQIQHEMAARVLELGGQAEASEQMLAVAGSCLDQRLPPAVRQARASPALVDALKEYFTAAQSFRLALTDISGGRAAFLARAARASAPHAAAVQKVRMEVLLAQSQEPSE